MPKPPLILLPPSEGKASGGDGPAWAPGSMELDLDDRRLEVIDALAKAMRRPERDRAKLLGVKTTALNAATAANRSVLASLTVPSIERYTGVLFDALDHRSLSATHRRRLNASVLILSGLWGAVAPQDPIPDYKLKMGASLGRLGKLSSWWREELSGAIGRMASGRRVWNLLPAEHAAAWRAPDGLEQWSVRFLDPSPSGELVAVSHANKALKGALVRFLLTDPAIEPDDLAAWEHLDGYRLRRSLDERRNGVTTLALVRPH